MREETLDTKINIDVREEIRHSRHKIKHQYERRVSRLQTQIKHQYERRDSRHK